MNKLPFTKPLVLVPDTDIQRIPESNLFFKPPCSIPQETFDIMASGAFHFSAEAGFEMVKKPAYEIYNNALFADCRESLWIPLMEAGYPIYIVNPFCGLLWPGDSAGMYNLDMENAFWFWRIKQLWKVTLALFDNNTCDGVMSFLPNIYNNTVYLEETPWIQYPVDDFWDYTEPLLKLAAYSIIDGEKKQTPSKPRGNL